MKNLIIALFIFGGVLNSSAQNINEYKYILVPESFEFTGEINKYQLNSLLKFLFEKEGFNTVMKSGDKPRDLANNSCLGLKSNVINNSGLFVTKLVIQLEDCQGDIIFKSKEGSSREKDFKSAYHEALRDAFTSIQEINYNYQQGEITEVSNSEEKGPAKKTVKLTMGAEVVTAGDNTTAENAEELETGIMNEEMVETGAPRSESKKDADLKYNYSGKTYFLKKSTQGYNLFQEGSTEPIAILIASEEGKSFIYNSLTKQGIGFFDADKNLMVEYFDRANNKKVTLKYELAD